MTAIAKYRSPSEVFPLLVTVEFREIEGILFTTVFSPVSVLTRAIDWHRRVHDMAVDSEGKCKLIRSGESVSTRSVGKNMTVQCALESLLVYKSPEKPVRGEGVRTKDNLCRFSEQPESELSHMLPQLILKALTGFPHDQQVNKPQPMSGPLPFPD